jgi:hypothetical protein
MYNPFGPVRGVPQQPQQPPQGFPSPQGRQPPQAPSQGRGLLGQFGGFDPSAYAAGAQAQSAKDQAAFSAYGNLGIAGQNAMGQYGMNRDAQLTNQSIAAANAYGQMANNYYNTMGQLGQTAAGLSAAGLNAGAQSASGNMSSNFNMGMGGGFNSGGGGWPGFTASGPEGTIASGRMGGGGGGGFGFGGNVSGGGGASSSISKGSSQGERAGLVNQGYGFLGDVKKTLNDPKNQAMALAGLMGEQFGANRAAVMDPTIVNSLNSQMATGYNALGGLYGMSDYGFNTGRRAPAATYQPMGDNSQYWMDPKRNRNQYSAGRLR